MNSNRLALDASCMVALVSGWHERHVQTLRTLEEAVRGNAQLVVPAPALVETYAVLTRLPAPHRISPAEAMRLLEANFRAGARTVSLSPAETWTALRAAPGSGVAGGRTYDAMIAACVRKVGPATLLTLNARDFGVFADESLAVLEPPAA